MQPSQVASIHTAGVSLESDAPAATAEHTRWQILFDGCMQNGTSSRRPYKKTAVLSISFKDTDLTNLHTEVRPILSDPCGHSNKNIVGWQPRASF